MPSRLRSRKIFSSAAAISSNSKVTVTTKTKKAGSTLNKKVIKPSKPLVGRSSKDSKLSTEKTKRKSDHVSSGVREKSSKRVEIKSQVIANRDTHEIEKTPRTPRRCKVEAQTNIKLLSSPLNLFSENKSISVSPKVTGSSPVLLRTSGARKKRSADDHRQSNELHRSGKVDDESVKSYKTRGRKSTTPVKGDYKALKSRLTRNSIKNKSLCEEIPEPKKDQEHTRTLRTRDLPIKKRQHADSVVNEVARDNNSGLLEPATKRLKVVIKDITQKHKAFLTSYPKAVHTKTESRHLRREISSDDSFEVESEDEDGHLEDTSGESIEEEDDSGNVTRTSPAEDVEKPVEDQKKKDDLADELYRLKNVFQWKQEQLVDLQQVHRQNTVLRKKIAQLTKSTSQQVTDDIFDVSYEPVAPPECSSGSIYTQIDKYKESINQVENKISALESAVELNMELESRLNELQHSKEREQYYEKEEERRKKNEEAQKQTEKALLNLRQENEKLQEMVKKAREDQWKNEQDRMKTESSTLHAVNGMLEGMLKNLMKGIGTQVLGQNPGLGGCPGASSQGSAPGFSPGTAFFPGYGWMGSNSLPPSQALAQMADMLAAQTIANAKGQTANQYLPLIGQPLPASSNVTLFSSTAKAAEAAASLVSLAETLTSSSSTSSQHQRPTQPCVVDLTQSPVVSPSVPVTTFAASQGVPAPTSAVDRSKLYFTSATSSAGEAHKMSGGNKKMTDAKMNSEISTKQVPLVKIDRVKIGDSAQSGSSKKKQDGENNLAKGKVRMGEEVKTASDNRSKEPSDIEILDTSAESSSLSEKDDKKINERKKVTRSKKKQIVKKKAEPKDQKKKGQEKDLSTPRRKSPRGSKTENKQLESNSESNTDRDSEHDSDILIIGCDDEKEKVTKRKSKICSSIKTPKRRTRSRKKEVEEGDSGAEADEDEDEEGSDNEENGKEGSKKDKKEEGTPGQYKRRDIQRLLKRSNLKKETLEAEKAEKERLKRVEEIKKKHHIVQVPDSKSPSKCPVTTKLVLEMDTKAKPVVEVNTRLTKKLKPHQVEAVEFQWDCCIESLDTLKKEEGSGCILAHCMGLGKTLSAITLVHTLLTNKTIGLKTCLVVCPLNTVLNWEHELNYWLEKRDRLKVYEIVSVKVNKERAELLKKWHNGGGVMIMGYQMFRILSHSLTKSRVQKDIFTSSLLDPGPDVVICDEGHMLKNDSSAISKAMNKIRTLRRIVLTGTPLQNNLAEYHCMVNFVKPNLLGTRKEFSNRFVNPIMNGQCSDSTPLDVKLMKKRSHVLHEMLSGCVQRRDYSALTKYLPEKYEYILSVRLSPIQMKLYQEYLNRTGRNKALPKGLAVGASLFQDYHHLHRIWTHPWVLRMEQIRQENRMVDDGASSFAESSDEEESEVDTDVLDEVQSSTPPSSSSSESFMSLSESDSEAPKKGKRKKRKSKDTESKRGLRKDERPEVGDVSTKDETGEMNKKKAVSKHTKRSSVSNDKKSPKPPSTRKKGEDKEIRYRDLEDELRTRIHGECVRGWKSLRRGGKEFIEEAPKEREKEWWEEYIKEEDQYDLALSGKLMLLFDIIRMSEAVGDKVLVFSQSLLSLDLIEHFLAHISGQAKAATNQKKSRKKQNPLYTTWTKNEDYFRIDGSTVAQNRQKYMGDFQDHKNTKGRLFLISTKAGSLGINLEAANRVVIFDASWNPSHDIQSIFRVYRFGQEKPVFVYRLLAQGTMEEKIYQRQVSKQSLSQRVVDEQQIERHFSAADLAELYNFKPERLDDPDREKKPTPKLPKDKILAELLSSRQDWLVGYHEHDSLLQNIEEENLTEEERKAAWEEYENEKQGIFTHLGPAFAPPPPPMEFKFTYQRPPAPYRNIASNPLLQPHQPSMTGRPPSLASFPNFNQQLTLGINQHLPPGVPLTPQFHQQLQRQLPNVIQAILKTNPGVSIDELQRRLQQFLKTQLMYHFQAILKQQGFPYKKLPTGAEQAQAQQVEAQQAQSGSTTVAASTTTTTTTTSLPFMPSLTPNPVVNLRHSLEEVTSTGTGQPVVIKANVHNNGAGDKSFK